MTDDTASLSQETITYTELGEDGETVTLSIAQHKLAAIRAHLNGVWDHPALTYYGPMTVNTHADLMAVLNA